MNDRNTNEQTFFNARLHVDISAKIAVAMHISRKIVKPLGSIFMDGGSTNTIIAEAIAMLPQKRFTVMTNNVSAFEVFKESQVRVQLTGGFYDKEDEALLGRGARFDLTEFYARWSIVGASCISATNVYNHAITGEEQVKRHYWEIPSNHLIVPATLRKFGGKDASCFGTLFRDPTAQGESVLDFDSRENGESDYVSIAQAQNEEIRDQMYKEDSRGHAASNAPCFMANRCTIVIEPEWMIEADYSEEERQELVEIVDEIRSRTSRTDVSVVNSKVTEAEFEEGLNAEKSGFKWNKMVQAERAAKKKVREAKAKSEKAAKRERKRSGKGKTKRMPTKRKKAAQKLTKKKSLRKKSSRK